MKLKLNWGNYIVIAYAIFMIFILFFVYKVQTNSKYDNDLVVEEYYKHDAHFQDELDKIQNSENLKEMPAIVKTKDGIQINFPIIFESNKIVGKVSFYRSSNKKLDFEVPISGSELLIPSKNLVAGLWEISILWNYDKKEYITKKAVYF
jgi:hypothetical protein